MGHQTLAESKTTLSVHRIDPFKVTKLHEKNSALKMNCSQ